MTKKCTHCKEQDEPRVKEISLVASECEATRQHATIKRLIWMIMLLTVMLFGSNLAWIVYGVNNL